MFEMIKQKPLIGGLFLTFLIGITIGLTLSFTLLNKDDGPSDVNNLGDQFILATGGTAILSKRGWKIEGENWEQIQPITLTAANNLGWEKEVTCVPNVGYYSKKVTVKDFGEPYSLIFNERDIVIGIYLFSETQQKSPWEKMQAIGPYPYPHWGLHIFFTNPSTEC